MSTAVTAYPLVAAMTEEQRALFYMQLSAVEKDEVAGVLLALFLGTFGLHHFYLGRTGLGVLYVLFFWTGIPAVAGFVECFLMPGRVRRYNLEQAMLLASALQGGVSMVTPTALPAYAAHCTACGEPLAPGVRFCARCGATV